MFTHNIKVSLTKMATSDGKCEQSLMVMKSFGSEFLPRYQLSLTCNDVSINYDVDWCGWAIGDCKRVSTLSS